MYRELICELSQGNAFVKIQPPCPEKEINAAEEEVGYLFPKELGDLLRELNGDKWFLLSAKEIIENAKCNREIQEEYREEDFVKELDKFLFFATNGCGDYYCYHADSDGVLDETVIYLWNHENYFWKPIAANMEELITRYYKSEIE